MQRTYCLHIQSCQLFNHHLHLRAVFSADIKVVSARLACPVVSLVHQRTKLTKAIGTEQHLVGGIVTHYHLRPVYHSSTDKLQCMLAQWQCVTLFHGDYSSCKVHAIKEVGQHLYSLSAAHQLHSGISLQHPGYQCRVVGLHVVSHQIVRLVSVQGFNEVCLPLLTLTGIGCVQHCNLLIFNEIRVITHALGHHILTLKQIDVQIVYTDVLYAVAYHIHSYFLCP